MTTFLYLCALTISKVKRQNIKVPYLPTVKNLLKNSRIQIQIQIQIIFEEGWDIVETYLL